MLGKQSDFLKASAVYQPVNPLARREFAGRMLLLNALLAAALRNIRALLANSATLNSIAVFFFVMSFSFGRAMVVVTALDDDGSEPGNGLTANGEPP